jgi:hypothetical protein
LADTLEYRENIRHSENENEEAREQQKGVESASADDGEQYKGAENLKRAYDQIENTPLQGTLKTTLVEQGTEDKLREELIRRALNIKQRKEGFRPVEAKKKEELTAMMFISNQIQYIEKHWICCDICKDTTGMGEKYQRGDNLEIMCKNCGKELIKCGSLHKIRLPTDVVKQAYALCESYIAEGAHKNSVRITGRERQEAALAFEKIRAEGVGSLMGVEDTRDPSNVDIT